MSILLGPYDSSDGSEKKVEDDELLVFGYACKLYRDDGKAIMENSGQLLIPWMGDSSLMVDRYDVRNRLDDKRKFGLKSNLPRRLTAEEEELELELDKERYLALEWDHIRVEEQEEAEKRKRESGGFNAVQFTYNDPIPAHEPVASGNLQLPEHPPTSSVDCDEEDRFIPPPGLVIPDSIQAPSTNKLHSIIEKTATFISKQGTQMEIIIKTKQKFNPFFSFLNYGDVLFPYYKHLKELIKVGSYQPCPGIQRTSGGSSKPKQEAALDVAGVDKSKQSDVILLGSSRNERTGNGGDCSVPEVKESLRATDKVKANRTDSDNDLTNLDDDKRGIDKTTTVRNKVSASTSNLESSSDLESDDDDGGGYLHPLLMKASLKPSTPEQPTVMNTSKPTRKLTIEELVNLHNDASFAARSRAINSAPPPVSSGTATHSQDTSGYSTASNSEAVAAYYEYYRQQYYGSAMSCPPAPDDAHSCYQMENDSYHPSYDGYTQQQLHTDGNPLPSTQGYPYGHPSYHYSNYMGQLPPSDLRPIIDKTAEYVAKNSDTFEKTVLERHVGDPRFGFLNPWDPHHAYYQAMKQFNRARMEQGGMAAPPIEEIASKSNVQKLSSYGTVSFKVQAKAPPTVGLMAPCSEFDSKVHAEEEPEEECGVVDHIEQPPIKKQRLTNGDQMGNTVQAFLSTVKGLFGSDSTT